MAYDGLVTRAITNELNNIILNGKIDKIHQPSKDDVIFSIRSLNKNYKLILSANAQFARVHITEKTFENPEKPFNFCMVLRKHLSGAKIIKIEQISNDRILKFTFENSNELGDKENKILIIEIMGKYSNIMLLTPKSTIIDSLKHIDFEISRIREVMPGRPYILPQTQDKTNPFKITQKEFYAKFSTQNTTLHKFITENYLGISTMFAKEIENKNLEFINEINKPISPCTLSIDNSINDFYIYPITQKNYDIKNYNSVSQAIDTYYTYKLQKNELNNKKNELLSVVSASFSKNEKKMQIILEKLKTTDDMENLRISGELLTANLYKLNNPTDKITLFNYYTNEDIDIKLDINLSPSENLQKIFKKYSKLKNTYNACISQKEEVQNELNYLESIFFEIDSVDSIEEITEIKLELINQGYLKMPKKAIKNTPSKPLKLIFNDFEIYVGKNNIQNDYLTFTFASKNDIWLHAKNIPGSHTIIKTNGQEALNEVIVYAATYAAKHSKAKNSPKVDIDYTFVKNVKKIPGAKPGMVTYTNFKTIYIEPAKN